MISLTYAIPNMVNEEDDESLLLPVIMDEISEAICHMQHDKSPSLDGWLVEFFKAFMELFDQDILTIIEDSRVKGRILAPLNSTLIAFIPKKHKCSSFNDYQPIFLCNTIYKFNMKFISRCIRGILLKIHYTRTIFLS